MALQLLGSATWSVLNFVRTDLRTGRLAIAYGERSHRAMHPSQVAVRSDMRAIPGTKTSKLGGII